MIDQHSRNNSPEGRVIDPETGNEAKKSIFISAPYFPGLSESFKQLFQVHTRTGLLQRPKYHQVDANASQRQGGSFPQKGCNLPMVMHQA